MCFRPGAADLDLFDGLEEPAFGDNRNGEELRARGGFDTDAVMPMSLPELDPIKYYILVAAPNQAEKPAPWDIGGLYYADAHIAAIGKRARSSSGGGAVGEGTCDRVMFGIFVGSIDVRLVPRTRSSHDICRESDCELRNRDTRGGS
jgi:hypothetical protein